MPKIPTIGQWDFTYTAIPNYFLDQIAHTLKESELRVILYVYRHTLGYHKLSDCISYEQFMHGITTQAGQRLDHGASVSRRALVPALAALEEKGLISRTHQGYRAVITISLPPGSPTTAPTQAKVETTHRKEQTLPPTQVQDSPIEPEKVVQDSPPTKEPSPTKNNSQKRAADLPGLVRDTSEYLRREVVGLSAKEAHRLASLAIEQNQRDFAYVKQLVEYVTSSPVIRVPAAVLTTLIRSNETRTVSSQLEPLCPETVAVGATVSARLVSNPKTDRYRKTLSRRDGCSYRDNYLINSTPFAENSSPPTALFPVEEYPHLWRQICQHVIERWDLNPIVLHDGQLHPGSAPEEIQLILPAGDAATRIRLSQALEEAIGGDYHYRLVWS